MIEYMIWRLKEAVVNWVMKPAHWYQFWLPQSGPEGAAVFLLVMVWTDILLTIIFGN
jgi:hypothetical protein